MDQALRGWLIATACVLGTAGCGGFGGHHSLVAADAAGSPPPEPEAVRVTYLGCNGYLLESADAAVVIDPYFSRIGSARIALDLSIRPHEKRVARALEEVPRLRQPVDAFLVTHGHFDHLLDVPVVARESGSPVVASRSSIMLAVAAGLPGSQGVTVAPGDRKAFGAAVVHVLPASHDRVLFNKVPFPGNLESLPLKPPSKPSDWVVGEPLAFLVEIGGKRVYIDSGGTMDVLPTAGLAPVDLAILGVAVTDSRDRFAAALERLRPRFVIPSHQDDFFRPLDRGFKFGALTDFDAVRAAHARAGIGRLILLDYFRPWTLR